MYFVGTKSVYLLLCPLPGSVLFEGISKSILFNSVLNFAILSVFNVINEIIWH